MTYQKPVSEEELNQRSQEKGAARVTLEAVENNIFSENYITAYDGAVASLAGTDGSEATGQVPESLRLLTFYILTLRNGFTVTGQSACADPNNFDAEIGRKIARGDAIRQIWSLMGYELRSKLARMSETTNTDLDEALTRLLAYSYGNAEAFREQDANAILNEFQDSED